VQHSQQRLCAEMQPQCVTRKTWSALGRSSELNSDGPPPVEMCAISNGHRAMHMRESGGRSRWAAPCRGGRHDWPACGDQKRSKGAGHRGRTRVHRRSQDISDPLSGPVKTFLDTQPLGCQLGFPCSAMTRDHFASPDGLRHHIGDCDPAYPPVIYAPGHPYCTQLGHKP
jgi:hypothetical protein